MKPSEHATTITALILCSGSPLMAQVNDVAPLVDAVSPKQPAMYLPEAIGDPVAGPYNIERDGELGQLGVDHAFGHYWVTARHQVNPNHAIWKFDETGNFVKAYDQDIASKASAWGYRDGTSDEGANQLYFGWDDGGFVIHEYNPATGDISGNCTMTVPNVDTIRALARTPAGTFITKDFGGSIYEFDTAGRTLNTWPDPGISAYGCAYDASADSYWWSGGNAVVSETDSSMIFTGRSFDARQGFTAFAAQGGLDIYADARSHTGDAFVMLGQGTPDEVSIFEANFGAASLKSTGPARCNIAPPPPPPPPLSLCYLDTIFASNNRGNEGGIIFMDLAIGNEDLTFPGLEVNSSLEGGSPFQIEWWIRPITYIGGECAAAEWTLIAVGNGQGEGVDKMSRVVFQNPPTLAAGRTVGVALVGVGTNHEYTNGTGANQSYSDPSMSLRLGAAQNLPFDCTTFAPRVWNGRYYYEPASGCTVCPPCACDFDRSTGPGVCDIFDFLAFQNEFVNGNHCACDFSTSGQGGICDIFDFLDFQISFVAGPCP